MAVLLVSIFAICQAADYALRQSARSPKLRRALTTGQNLPVGSFTRKCNKLVVRAEVAAFV